MGSKGFGGLDAARPVAHLIGDTALSSAASCASEESERVDLVSVAVCCWYRSVPMTSNLA